MIRIIGLLVIVSEYLSMMFNTLSYKGDVYAYVGVLCGLFAITCSAVIVNRQSANASAIVGQIRKLSIPVIAINSVILLALIMDYHSTIGICMGLECLGWIGVGIYCLVKIPITEVNRKKVRENAWFLGLAFLIIALSYEPVWRQFKWDGYLYYMACHNINITSISGLTIYGHTSQTYGLLVGAMNSIIGDVGITLLLVNVSLLLLGAAYTYRLIGFASYRYVKIQLPDYLMAIMTGVVMLSPCYLGMVNYYSLDYSIVCLVPMVIYYTLRHEWLLQCISACFFVFTKEPAIIFYGCMCIGVVIADGVMIAKDTIDQRNYLSCVKRMLTTLHYYYMAIPGLLWYVVYKIMGPWSAGDGGVAIEASYVLEKLKCLFVLNFNWIYLVIVVLGSIGLVIHKQWHRGDIEWLVPLLCGMLGYALFSCVFKTANHPRYVDTAPFTNYILAMIILIKILSEDNRRVLIYISSVIAIIMLVSSYVTVDPLSLKLFETAKVGTSKIIMTGNNALGDGSIYNKQMLFLEKPYADAISSAIEGESIVIVPNVGESSYYFDGMGYSGQEMDGVYLLNEYYSRESNLRVPLLTKEVPTYITGELPDNMYESAKELGKVMVCLSDRDKSLIDIRDNMSSRGVKLDNNQRYTIIYINEDLQPGVEHMLSELDNPSVSQFNYRGLAVNAVTGCIR